RRCRGRSQRHYTKSALLLPERHRSNHSRAPGLRVARTHQTHSETKTRCHQVVDKSRYQDGKNVDQPALPKSQDNPAFLLLRDATECLNEICNRRRAHRPQRARRLRPRSKVSPAATRLDNRIVPSTWQKMVVLPRVLCGGNCWG